MNSPGMMIVRGLIMLATGFASMSAMGAIFLLLIRLVRAPRGERIRQTENVIGFIACAYVVAVVGYGVSTAMATPDDSQVRGTPGLWVVLALLFGVLWFALRSMKPSRKSHSSKKSNTSVRKKRRQVAASDEGGL